MDIFERATRKNTLFNTTKGQVNIQDLWNFKLEELDHIARSYARDLRSAEEESFITPKRKNADMQLRFDIVKHIIDYKLDVRDKQKKAAANKAEREKIMRHLMDKEDQEFRDMSKADLEKRLEELSVDNVDSDLEA